MWIIIWIQKENNLDLPIYLLLHALAEVCPLHVLLLYVFLPKSVIFIDSNTLINKLYSFITFSLLINNLMLLLNCLVLILAYILSLLGVVCFGPWYNLQCQFYI